MIAADAGARRAAVVRELELECGELRQLLSLLEEERAAVLSRDPERLAALVDQKLAHMRTLERFSTHRAALLQEAGYPADGDGMRAFARDAGPAATSAWMDLARTAADARDANVLNGELIRMHLDDVRARLGRLAAATGGTELYDASGHSHAALATRRGFVSG
jgi:flagellar biosynthesis/type III secretory pathway chaperone